MKLEHNSQDLFYRSPFGAVEEKSRVTLKLAISGGGIPKYVRVIYFIRDRDIKISDMYYVSDVGDFCIYKTEIQLDECAVYWYYFEADTENGRVYYANNEYGLGGIGKMYDEKPSIYFQITVFSKHYQTPEWWKNSICYQIFCDRFYNGNQDGSFLGKRQDIIKRNWNDEPFYKPEQFGGEYLSNDFFGGNIAGIIKKLDYLSELGIGAIYLNPIFKAYSNHKYDTGDYMQIDEMFGSDDVFKILCAEADKRGIRIILDGVFNHTGSDSRYFNKNGNYDSVGAYESIDSVYFEWYNFFHWNDDYEAWWGIKTLPRLKKNVEGMIKYFLTDGDSVVKHWIKAGASGWRLDVVDELPDEFVKLLRSEVKKEDPEAVIVGEVWEDASNKESYGVQREYFLGAELDSVMNYPLRDALIGAVTGKISAEELEARIMSLKENYPRPAFYSLMNILSSHDVERLITAVSGAPDRRTVSREYQAGFNLSGSELELVKKKARLLIALQMLLPGVPCIYYGDEAGMQGYGDPFNRRTYPWGMEDSQIFEWYKNMILLRKNNPAYIQGEFETLYKDACCWSYIRYFKDEKHLVAVNFSNKDVNIRIDAAKFGIRRIKEEIGKEEYISGDGIFYIKLLSYELKAFVSRQDI